MRALLAFLLFCSVEGSAWLLGEGVLNAPAGLILFGFACICVGVTLTAMFRRGTVADRRVSPWALMLTSVAAIGVPAVLTAVSRQHLGASTVLAAWCFLPAVVAGREFFQHVGLNTAGEEGTLGWALCGVGGELLLLPVSLPSSSEGRFALIMLLTGVLFAGVASPRLFDLLRGRGSLLNLGGVSLASGVFVTFTASLWIWFDRSLLLDSQASLSVLAVLKILVETACLLVFLRSVKPLMYSTRVLFAPALGVLEGAAVFRTGLSMRMIVGVLLVLVATTVLWRKDQEDVTPSISLSA